MRIHPNVNPVFHGLGLQYDNGETPAVALNAHGKVVEVHRNAAGIRLYHRVGRLKEAIHQRREQCDNDGYLRVS